MKKATIMVLFTLVSIQYTSAQWNNSGNNASTGNLTIGSSAPSSYSKLTIKGPNSPVGINSMRDISFEFAAAGKAQIKSYRGGSWDTYLQFLTTPHTGGSPMTRMHIHGDGKIGIGTSSPAAMLHINNGNNSYGAILANATEYNFSLYAKTINTQPAYSESFRLGLKYGSNENNGFISFYRGGSSSGGFLGLSTSGLERVRINADGNVGIGTSSTSSKLTVAGNIHAREVRVTATAGGADFVFESDYKLPSLHQVASFIKENKHLPEIPSAKEMDENGLDLAKMNIQLLQKIEELTLYTIQQQKEIQALKEQNSVLSDLQSRLEKLEDQ